MAVEGYRLIEDRLLGNELMQQYPRWDEAGGGARCNITNNQGHGCSRPAGHPGMLHALHWGRDPGGGGLRYSVHSTWFA